MLKKTTSSPHLQIDAGTSNDSIGASGFGQKDDFADNLIEIKAIAKEHE